MSVDHLIQDLLASRESTMAEAYGLALDTLGIEDTSDPRAQSIALAILILMRDGEMGAERIASKACWAISLSPQPLFAAARRPLPSSITIGKGII
jgi:hypothetical protein